MKYEIYLKTRNRNNFEIFVDIEKNNWFERNVIWFVFFKWNHGNINGSINSAWSIFIKEC